VHLHPLIYMYLRPSAASLQLPLSLPYISFPSPPLLSPDRLRRWKVLEPSEMRRSRRQRNGGGGGGGSGQRGGRVAVAFAVLLGCVMALVGGAAAQGPRLPSDYKTLSGTVTHPSIPALQLSRCNLVIASANSRIQLRFSSVMWVKSSDLSFMS
jgi:hypothetical protein